MAIKVQTILFNPTSSMRVINISRGKTERVRAGETVVLDYDIYSLLTTMSKRALDHEIKTGRLTVQTRVISGDTNFTVDAGTEKHSLSNEPVKDTPKDKKDTLPKAEFKEDEREKKMFPGKQEAPSTTAQEKDKIVDALGVSVVKDEETATTGAAAPRGFNVVSQSGQQEATASNDSVNIFESKQEEPVAEEPASDEAAVNATEESIESVINQLYANKAYADIHAELVARYPEISFTKTAVKKCTSFAELKALYPAIG